MRMNGGRLFSYVLIAISVLPKDSDSFLVRGQEVIAGAPGSVEPPELPPTPNVLPDENAVKGQFGHRSPRNKTGKGPPKSKLAISKCHLTYRIVDKLERDTPVLKPGGKLIIHGDNEGYILVVETNDEYNDYKGRRNYDTKTGTLYHIDYDTFRKKELIGKHLHFECYFDRISENSVYLAYVECNEKEKKRAGKCRCFVDENEVPMCEGDIDCRQLKFSTHLKYNVCLSDNNITSLCHNWQHPAVPFFFHSKVQRPQCNAAPHHRFATATERLEFDKLYRLSDIRRHLIALPNKTDEDIRCNLQYTALNGTLVKRQLDQWTWTKKEKIAEGDSDNDPVVVDKNQLFWQIPWSWYPDLIRARRIGIACFSKSEGGYRTKMEVFSDVPYQYSFSRSSDTEVVVALNFSSVFLRSVQVPFNGKKMVQFNLDYSASLPAELKTKKKFSFYVPDFKDLCKKGTWFDKDDCKENCKEKLMKCDLTTKGKGQITCYKCKFQAKRALILGGALCFVVLLLYIIIIFVAKFKCKKGKKKAADAVATPEPQAPAEQAQETPQQDSPEVQPEEPPPPPAEEPEQAPPEPQQKSSKTRSSSTVLNLKPSSSRRSSGQTKSTQKDSTKSGKEELAKSQ